MSFRIPKVWVWTACGVLLLALLPMGWKLKTLKKRADRISLEISNARKAAAQCRQEAGFIRERLEGRLSELKKNTVDMDNPIVWCVGWIRNRVGLSEDIDIECIGTKPPVGMAMGRSVRDSMEGTVACLAPYSVRLDLREATLGTLEYVLEQLESPDYPCIVTYLEVNSPESGKGCSATAMVSLPIFQYPEDWRDIRDFLASEVSGSLPAEGAAAP